MLVGLTDEGSLADDTPSPGGRSRPSIGRYRRYEAEGSLQTRRSHARALRANGNPGYSNTRNDETQDRYTYTITYGGGESSVQKAIRIITRITTLDNSQEAEPAIGRGRRVVVWSVRHWALGLPQEPTLVSLTA